MDRPEERGSLKVDSISERATGALGAVGEGLTSVAVGGTGVAVGLGSASEQEAKDSTNNTRRVAMRCGDFNRNPLAARIGYLSQSPGPVHGPCKGARGQPFNRPMYESQRRTQNCDRRNYSLARRVCQMDNCPHVLNSLILNWRAGLLFRTNGERIDLVSV